MVVHLTRLVVSLRGLVSKSIEVVQQIATWSSQPVLTVSICSSAADVAEVVGTAIIVYRFVGIISDPLGLGTDEVAVAAARHVRRCCGVRIVAAVAEPSIFVRHWCSAKKVANRFVGHAVTGRIYVKCKLCAFLS